MSASPPELKLHRAAMPGIPEHALDPLNTCLSNLSRPNASLVTPSQRPEWRSELWCCALPFWISAWSNISNFVGDACSSRIRFNPTPLMRAGSLAPRHRRKAKETNG